MGKRKMKVEIYKSKGGFRFRIKGSNGRVVATGEEYKTKQSLKNTIYRLMDDLVDAEIMEVS